MSRLCDYFVVCGLSDEPIRSTSAPERDFGEDVTEIAVTFCNEQKLGDDYILIEETITPGLSAMLDLRSLSSMFSSADKAKQMSAYLAYKHRLPGDERPAISDIILVHSTTASPGYEVITQTPFGAEANIGTQSRPTYLAIKRESRTNTLFSQDPVIQDLCIVADGRFDDLPEEFAIMDGQLNQRGAKLFLALYRTHPLGLCDIPFTPTVLDRFPEAEYPDFPLPHAAIPMFSFPQGLKLVLAAPNDAPLATYFPYVLTDATGGKIFVASVTFYEPMTTSDVLAARESVKDLVNEDIKLPGDTPNAAPDKVLFVPKCIAVVSHWPFFRTFRSWLSQLYTLSLSQSELPLERWISHFVTQCPLPPVGSSLTLRLDARMNPIVVELPSSRGLPVFNLTFHSLFSSLDVTNFMTLFALVLLERKVVIVSKHASVVTEVCESLRCLLFPLEWESCYVPRLTAPLLDCLEFPGGILVGVHDDTPEDPILEQTCLMWKVRTVLPPDATLINLDLNHIQPSKKNPITWRNMPAKPARMMKDRLEALLSACEIRPQCVDLSHLDRAFDMAPIPASANGLGEIYELENVAVRDIALTCMAGMLDKYNEHLLAPTANWETNMTEWFDKDCFVATADRSARSFLLEMCSTQMFSAFVQKRTESSDLRLLFFDYCTQSLRGFKPPPSGAWLFTTDKGDRKLLGEAVTDSMTSKNNLNLNSRKLGSVRMDPKLPSSKSSEHNEAIELPGPSSAGLEEGRVYSYTNDGILIWPKKLDHTLYDQHVDARRNTLLKDVLSAHLLLLRDTREAQTDRRLSMHDQPADEGERIIHSPATIIKQTRRMVGEVFGAWYLCLPDYSARHYDQDQALLQAYGALVLMRKWMGLNPDETAFRALIVACGRNNSPHRSGDVLHIFQELKECAIRPNAITYGQYTQAIAKAATSAPARDVEPKRRVRRSSHLSSMLAMLRDGSLLAVVDAIDAGPKLLRNLGIRWRGSWFAARVHSTDGGGHRFSESHATRSIPEEAAADEMSSLRLDDFEDELHRSTREDEAKVSISWPASIHAFMKTARQMQQRHDSDIPDSRTSVSSVSTNPDIGLQALARFPVYVVAMWSANQHSSVCNIPLNEEEIMAGWNPDLSMRDERVQCPHHGNPKTGDCPVPQDVTFDGVTAPEQCFTPYLRFRIYSMTGELQRSEPPSDATQGVEGENLHAEERPFPQHDEFIVTPTSHTKVGYLDSASSSNVYKVPFYPPSVVRSLLEERFKEHGDQVFHRDFLRDVDPELFWNLWWWSNRVGLPLPLIPAMPHTHDGTTKTEAGAQTESGNAVAEANAMWVLVTGWDRVRTLQCADSAIATLWDKLGVKASAGEPAPLGFLGEPQRADQVWSDDDVIPSHPLLQTLAPRHREDDPEVVAHLAEVMSLLVGEGPIEDDNQSTQSSEKMALSLETAEQLRRVSSAVNKYLYRRRIGRKEVGRFFSASVYRTLLELNHRQYLRTQISIVSQPSALDEVIEHSKKAHKGHSILRSFSPRVERAQRAAEAAEEAMLNTLPPFDLAFALSVKSLSADERAKLFEYDRTVTVRAAVFRSILGPMF